MGKFVVTVHDGGGSMAEGMWPQKCFGLFGDEAGAQGFADAFYGHCAKVDKYLEQEMLTCVSEVEMPPGLPLEDSTFQADIIAAVNEYLGERGRDLIDPSTIPGYVPLTA